MESNKTFILSISSGLLLGLAWQPQISGVIVFFGLVPLLFAEHFFSTLTKKIASHNVFLHTWLAFAIWNALVFWWASKASWFGVFATVVLNSFLYAIVFWLFHLSKKKFGFGYGFFALLFYWLSFEYIHSRWALAFPWLNLGNALGNNTGLIQWYDITGIAGGTALILMVNFMIFRVLIHIWEFKTVKGAVGNIIILLALLIIPFIISQKRYNTYKTKDSTRKTTIVQPDINPYTEKFDSSRISGHIDLFMHLADSASRKGGSPDFIAGPETLIPYSVWEDSLQDNKHIRKLRKYAEKSGTNLVFGAVTKNKFTGTQAPPSVRYTEDSVSYRVFNSALYIDPTGSIDIYHKNILLLGVETMPFAGLMNPLADLLVDVGGEEGLTANGTKAGNFQISGDTLSIAPVICWESVFGNYVAKFARNEADMLFIITNDGWWGNTPGYKMHLMFSRLRAIETRKGVVRAANTGISAFINSRGEITSSIGWGKEQAITQNVTVNDTQTHYAENGNFIGRISLFFGVLLLLYTGTYGLIRK